MNKARRKALAVVVSKLDEAYGLLEEIQSDEQEAYDNIPESLKGCDRSEYMNEILDTLGDAVDSLDDLRDNLTEIAEE